ncbi:MAG: PAS domain-containing protein, partial [Gemmatimonadota bacterium]
MSPASPLDYAAVFDAIPVAATLIDAQGIVLDVNQAFLALARRAGRDLQARDRVGRHVSDFVS